MIIIMYTRRALIGSSERYITIIDTADVRSARCGCFAQMSYSSIYIPSISKYSSHVRAATTKTLQQQEQQQQRQAEALYLDKCRVVVGCSCTSLSLSLPCLINSLGDVYI